MSIAGTIELLRKVAPYGIHTVTACCEKCRKVWKYDNRERLGADRPLCTECEIEKPPIAERLG